MSQENVDAFRRAVAAFNGTEQPAAGARALAASLEALALPEAAEVVLVWLDRRGA